MPVNIVKMRWALGLDTIASDESIAQDSACQDKTPEKAPEEPLVQGPWVWASFPYEIQTLLLECVVGQFHGKDRAAAAVVSRQWQSAIEKENFGTLKLRVDDLKGLSQMVRPRPLIKYIWLHVMVPDTQSHIDARGNVIPLNKRSIVNKAIVEFLKIIGTWDQATGITWELSVQGIGDDKDCFKNLAFPDQNQNPDPVENIVSPSSDDLESLFKWNDDTRPDWACLQFESIPRAPAITAFAIRRHTRRFLDPRDIEAVLRTLSELESLRYEGWARRKPEVAYNERVYMNLTRLVEGLTQSFIAGRISYFSDFNEDYNVLLETPTDAMEEDPDSFGKKSPTLTKTFAEGSLLVDEMYVSFAINASKFFACCGKDWEWEWLRSLVLTSSDLALGGDKDKASELLLNAGKAALKMEKLETLVLWFGKRGEACSFTYNQAQMAIKWRSTWAMDIPNDIIETWAKVAASPTRPWMLRVEYEELSSSDILSHGDAIHRLMLPEEVIDPTSLQQIHQEARPTNWMLPGSDGNEN